MPSGRPYPAETKARAMAALTAGESPVVVAREMDIPLPTVRGWYQQIRRENIIDDSEKKAELGELVAGYLQDILETLAAQARFVRDESWLRQQNASDVAILHGVLNDKAVRILAALQSPEDAQRS